MSEPAAEANPVMDDLLEAFAADAGEEPEEETTEETVAADEAEDEETEDVAGEEDTTEEEPEGDESEDEEPEEDTGEPTSEPVSFSTDDPAILAYLARYDNDPQKALKAAVELQRVLTRQGREKNQAVARVRELEDELEQARMFADQPSWLNPEQQEYVQNAIQSEQPQAWVQQAVRAGEFDLARAIVDQWAESNPYQAMRAAQFIDNIEYRTAQQSQMQGVDQFDRNELLQRLAQVVPDMPQYEAAMLSAMAKLGDNHPLVHAAKHGDENATASAIVSLYEIAKASTATVKETKQRIKQQSKEAALAARQAAVVSSGNASPSGGQTPRKTMIAPGLSLEDLDAEFAQQS